MSTTEAPSEILSTSQPTLGSYFELTKPTISLLVVITALPAIVMAGASIDPIQFTAALLGTYLASASAAIFNHIFEDRIDAVMTRTKKRPLPSGRVSRGTALGLAVILGGSACTILAVFTTPLAAWIAFIANVFYAVVYTLVLKPTTVQNIVIGGAAGAVGPLIGWAAVTGTLPWPAWMMFAIIFLWTPSHFWALALKYKDDYARAGIPMLPAIKGEEATRRQILGYSLALIPPCVVLSFEHSLGPVFAVPTAVATAVYVAKAWQLYRSRDTARYAMPLFHYSCVYLFLVFGSLTLDAVL